MSGVNDRKYPTRVDGVQVKSYGAWKNMLKRCYNFDFQKKYPTYIGCSTSDNFFNYSYFHEWCLDQVGYDKKGYHLDKDILTKGNKVYSEDTCVFVPNSLNQFLVSRVNFRGDNPLGVVFSKKRNLYHARVNDGFGKLKHIGYFENKIDAFNAYSVEKRTIGLNLSKFYDGCVDSRVIEALKDVHVDIGD